MAILEGDILQITDVQTYLTQQLLNVYFYKVDAAGSGANYQLVADAFQEQVIGEVRVFQSASLSHDRTIFKNLTNGLDIFEDVVGVFGADPGAVGPSFVALSVRLTRTTALTRHGSKRIGGLTENQYDGNEIAAATFAIIGSLESALESPVVIESGPGSGFSMSPVIVGRYPAEHANAGELDLSKINPVASAQYIRVSTQTTRRKGRGI